MLHESRDEVPRQPLDFSPSDAKLGKQGDDMDWIKVAIAAVATMTGGGCAAYTEKVASTECAKAGYSLDHPKHQDCMRNTRAAWKAEAQADILGGVAVAGAVASANATSPAPLAQTARHAPLVGQSYANFQRTCIYHAPSGDVSLVTPGGQMCPPTYSY